MKPWAWIIVVLLLAVLWFAARARQSPVSHSGKKPVDKSKTNLEVYLGLRNLITQHTRTGLGLPPGSTPTQPFAVQMDWGMPSGSATVVAMADGTASVYLSSGGGWIGLGQSHESIRAAAKKTVELADEVQPLMQATKSFPLPQGGEVFFYVSTDAGIFTAHATENDLSSGRSPFSKLGDSVQTIITECQRVQETK